MFLPTHLEQRNARQAHNLKVIGSKGLESLSVALDSPMIVAPVTAELFTSDKDGEPSSLV